MISVASPINTPLSKEWEEIKSIENFIRLDGFIGLSTESRCRILIQSYINSKQQLGYASHDISRVIKQDLNEKSPGTREELDNVIKSGIDRFKNGEIHSILEIKNEMDRIIKDMREESGVSERHGDITWDISWYNPVTNKNSVV